MADKRFFKFMAGLTFLFIFLSTSFAQEIKLLPVLTIGKDSIDTGQRQQTCD